MLLRATHHSYIRFGNLGRFRDRTTQLAFALPGLVTEQVLLARLAALELAGGGDPEALAHALVRLHLGHRNTRKKKRAPRLLQGVLEVRHPLVVPGRSKYCRQNGQIVQPKSVHRPDRRVRLAHALRIDLAEFDGKESSTPARKPLTSLVARHIIK